jgi:hypothetical protein
MNRCLTANYRTPCRMYVPNAHGNAAYGGSIIMNKCGLPLNRLNINTCHLGYYSQGPMEQQQ